MAVLAIIYTKRCSTVENTHNFLLEISPGDWLNEIDAE